MSCSACHVVPVIAWKGRLFSEKRELEEFIWQVPGKTETGPSQEPSTDSQVRRAAVSPPSPTVWMTCSASSSVETA
ncbi:hypothetical protein ACFPRL_29740 [Pseudoclavibacter helvolus]